MSSLFKNAGILVLAGAFALSGCSGNGNGTNNQAENSNQKDNFNATGLPVVNKPVSLRMVAPKAALAPEFSEMEIFKRLEQETNVKIDWENIPDTDYTEKKTCCLQVAICRMPSMPPDSLITS